MDPFIGEIRIFAGNFPPRGWAFCDGRRLAIAQYDALFALLGTTYGGDGRTNFALPDLRGRAPMHMGQGPGLTLHPLGEQGGSETVNVAVANLPPHSHTLSGLPTPATDLSPAGALPALHARPAFGAGAEVTSAATDAAGGGVALSNLSPTLSVSYIIAIFGIFPARG